MGVATFFLLIVASAVATFFVSSTKRMALLVIIAAFVTRPALEIGGLNLRLELLVGAMTFLRMIHDGLARKSQGFSAAVRWSLSFTLVWIAFAAVTSLSVPPFPQRSMSVLIWCFLNVITAVWIARTPDAWYWLLRWGSIAALACSLLAISFWVGATSHVFNFGVQTDPTYGGYAAYVFSIEANILAGMLCLWALVAVANPLGAVPRWTRLAIAFCAPVAILTTHTRAALVAYLVGLIACMILRSSARKVAVASLGVGGLAAILLLVGGGDVGLSKFMGVFDIDGGTGGLRYRVNNVAFAEWWSSSKRLIGLGWNSFGQRHIDETQPMLLLPGYIGNLPLQIAYDSGIIGAFWVVSAVLAVVIALRRLLRFDLLAIFLLPYVLFSIATSVLWLLETWIFVGLAWGLCSQSDAMNQRRLALVNLDAEGVDEDRLVGYGR